jgi:hypothetical protein
MTTFEHAIPRPAAVARTGAPATLGAAGARAVAFAVIANVVLFALGAPLGFFPQDVLVPGAGTPIAVPNVILDTVLGVGAGVGTLALLRRYAARPQQTFRRVAYVALVFSYTQPALVLQTAPVRMVFALNALHTAAAAIALWCLRGVGTAGPA